VPWLPAAVRRSLPDPGMVLSPLGPRPDIVGPDLADVVDQIIERDVTGKT